MKKQVAWIMSQLTLSLLLGHSPLFCLFQRISRPHRPHPQISYPFSLPQLYYIFYQFYFKAMSSLLEKTPGNKEPLLGSTPTPTPGGDEVPFKMQDAALRKSSKKVAAEDHNEEEEDDEAHQDESRRPRLIDFNEQLSDFKKRTEIDLPYTLTQTEDSIFVDKDYVMTLEYNYYQNYCKYTPISIVNESINNDGVLLDEEGYESIHQLGTQSYQLPENEPHHPMSQWPRSQIKNLRDSGIDILKQQKYLKAAQFMVVDPQTTSFYEQMKAQKLNSPGKKKKRDKEDDPIIVEPMIVKYKITNAGTMMRICNASLTMGCKYMQSADGNMTLCRSKDKKIISLCNFDKANKLNDNFILEAWKMDLTPVPVNKAVTDSMSIFYNSEKEHVSKLEEVSFIGNCKYVKMTYIEQRMRPVFEQQNYEIEIDNVLSSGRRPSESFQNKLDPRMARKHIFFDCNTGQQVFSYGGIQEPKEVTNCFGNQVPCYEIGMLFKEIKEEQFKPQLVIFVVGDFLPRHIKEGLIVMDWGLVTVTLLMDELFAIESQEAKMEFIREKIQEAIPCEANDYNKENFFVFDSTWITNNQFNWENDISVQATRRFDSFAFINTPTVCGVRLQSVVYMNGPKFLPNETMHEPYYVKLPPETGVQFSKNQLIKDQIFLDQTVGKETRTFCLRAEMPDPQNRYKFTNLTFTNTANQHDVFLQIKKNQVTGTTSEIFQSLSIPVGNQNLHFETWVPKQFIGKTPVNFSIVKRCNNLFYQQSADLPFIVYNIGDNRIFIQNAGRIDFPQIYILQLDDDEQFIGFVEFNSYTDIGFYPKDIRIECCSKFLFMTKKKGEGSNQLDNRLNLLLLDPFYSEFQGAWFKSDTYFDKGIWENQDFLVKNYIQSNRVSDHDTQFKTYIWSQACNGLLRSKMMSPLSKYAEDSDNIVDEAVKVVEKMKQDEFNFSNERDMLPIPMIQDDRGFIYYVVQEHQKQLNPKEESLDTGICFVIEGNPKSPYEKHHKTIFEIKTGGCIAFDLHQENFCLMDKDHNVYLLERDSNSRELFITQESTMKQILRLDFKPSPFDTVILAKNYSIFNSKIFYLYNQEDDPFPEGIFEAEELMEEKGDLIKGTYRIRASNKIYCVYRNNKFYSSIRIYQLPDMYSLTLVNDFQRQVDLSTFLENGMIMVKNRQRFLLFNSNGNFIDEVEFNNDNMEEGDEDDEDQLNNSLALIRMEFRGFQEEYTLPKAKLKALRDFKGFPYQISKKEPEPRVVEENKMKLMQFSSNNKFFLFHDQLLEKMIMYELCEVEVRPETQEGANFDLKSLVKEVKIKYEFMFQYELNFTDCHLFQHLADEKVDVFTYFKINKGQITITNTGDVKMCYCQNEASTSKADSSIKSNVIGCVFTKHPDRFISICKNFHCPFEFPRESFLQLAQNLDAAKEKLMRKINNLRLKMSRLPSELHDYSEYDQLIQELIELENKKLENIYAKICFDNLLIVYCGNSLLFSRVITWEEAEKQKKKKKKKGVKEDNDFQLALQALKGGKHFQEINCQFSMGVEIVKILETENKDQLMIISKDSSRNVFQILTWNFILNIEENMFQLLVDDTKDVGQHVIQGMNKKMNYYLDQDYLIDLEISIPMHQRNVDQQLDPEQTYIRQQDNIFDFPHQNKVFEDQQKFLGVEKPQWLLFSLCRTDITLWQNICLMGETLDIIRRTTTLDSFNLCFSGVSLFHYFAQNSGAIDVIYQKYILSKTNDLLEGTQNTLPMQAINPGNDGETALYLAIKNQSPKSFELMIQMLSDFPENMTSHMLLQVFSLILAHESPGVIDFLNIMTYQPPQMQVEQFIPWDESYEELIITSHTSVISRSLLSQKLIEMGIIRKKDTESKAVTNEENEDQPEELSKRELMLKNRRTLRDWTLSKSFSNDSDDVSLKRVTIEAVDMNWIFREGNANTLIKVLAGSANNQALTQKSIKCFVDLMWSHYQKTIIKSILVPYLAYMIMISYLTGFFIDPFYDQLWMKQQKGVELTDEFWQAHKRMRSQALIHTPCTYFLMLCFGSLEMTQLWAAGFEYFADYWNCIDITSLSLNFTFLTMFSFDLYFREIYFSKEIIMLIGSFASFFMWIKVFYWMRLFKSLAYFVKLIQQTIADSLNFMFMVGLITISFGNFFFVASKSLKEDQSYLGVFMHNEVPDSLITIYMLGALGDFDSGVFRQGYMGQQTMIMFLLATFVIAVVFMNMLIAIMSETFAQVLEGQVENGLREQVVLMEDHVWLIDLQQKFFDQRYILRIAPSSSGEGAPDEVVNEVIETRQALHKKVEKIHNWLNKKVKVNDDNLNFQLNNQIGLSQFILSKIRTIDLNTKESIENATDVKNGVSQESKSQKLALKAKKESFFSQLNSILGTQELSEQNIRDIALDFIDLVDTDKSGRIEYGEFYEFFQKLDGVYFTDREVKKIFSEFDSNGDGSITAEEFALLIKVQLTSESGTNGDQAEPPKEPEVEIEEPVEGLE